MWQEFNFQFFEQECKPDALNAQDALILLKHNISL